MVIVLGLLAAACASRTPRAALGWSLGGEAHVFVTGDRFARDFYDELTGDRHLVDSLRHRELLAVAVSKVHTSTVLSSNGAAPARLTLARFHGPGRCGAAEIVTELVLAFPPGGSAARAAPPSHVAVVALLDAAAPAGNARTAAPSLGDALTRELVTRVADRAAAETRGPPLGRLHRPVLDPDRAADAGEVFALGLDARYAVGFRVTFVGSGQDTTLVTGVATTDTSLRALRWVIRPRRLTLRNGMIASAETARYSLRGAVAGPDGMQLLLVDAITDVSARDARATAVDAATGRIVAAEPLALRCP